MSYRRAPWERPPVGRAGHRAAAWTLVAACVATAMLVVPTAAKATPRERSRLNPDTLAILQTPSKLAVSPRRHVLVRPDRVEFWQGATPLESIPYNGRAATLQGVAGVVARSAHPTWLTRVAPGVFLLRVALAQAPGSRLDVAAPAVREVRLLADPEIYISAVGAVGRYTGVQVTSWNPHTQRPERNPHAPRPFIHYGPGSSLQIVGSRFGYLGTDRSRGAYGVTWQGATGKALSSVFHHSFIGAYTSAARDIPFVGNVFRDNALHGLDAHDHTTGLRVLGNRAYRNGSRGIVLSLGVTGAVIRDNHSFSNGANGIVLDQRSDRNLIAGNLVEGNGGDGIVLLGSSNVTVRGNPVRANRVGIRVNLDSTRNRIEANQLDGNQRGIELYGGAREIQLTGNVVANSAQTGIDLKAPGSTSRNDEVRGGPVGIRIDSLASLEATTVSGAGQGIVVTERGIATLKRVQVRAGKAGVHVQPGGLVRIDDSQLAATSPLSGATPIATTRTSLISPEPGLPWLAAAGATFLLLAVALQVLHWSRNRPFPPSRRATGTPGTPPAGSARPPNSPAGRPWPDRCGPPGRRDGDDGSPLLGHHPADRGECEVHVPDQADRAGRRPLGSGLVHPQHRRRGPRLNLRR